MFGKVFLVVNFCLTSDDCFISYTSALDVLKKMSTFPREKKRIDHIDLKGYLRMNGKARIII